MAKTYLFSGNLAQGAWRFEEILRSRGYTPAVGDCVDNGRLRVGTACKVGPVGILHVEQATEKGYDPNIYDIQCDWQSRHDATSAYPITLKDRLHHSLADSPFVAKTYSLADFQYAGEVYILRPSHINVGSGNDIRECDFVKTGLLAN